MISSIPINVCHVANSDISGGAAEQLTGFITH